MDKNHLVALIVGCIRGQEQFCGIRIPLMLHPIFCVGSHTPYGIAFPWPEIQNYIVALELLLSSSAFLENIRPRVSQYSAPMMKRITEINKL